MALKLHFTTDYDFFKYNGKTRAISPEKLKLRKDYYHFCKIERRYKDKLEDFLVANFTKRPSAWVGDLVGIEAEKTYAEWIKLIESLKYRIRCDLEQIDAPPEKLIHVHAGGHPVLLRYYLGQKISLETMVALDLVLHYSDDWKNKINDEFIWPEVYEAIKNYTPFLAPKINRSEIRDLLLKVFLMAQS